MTLTIPDDLELQDPDELTFGELFAVKAATGIDVSASSPGEWGAAMLWYALKQRGVAVQWGQILDLKPSVITPHINRLLKRVEADQAAAKERRDANDEAAAVADQMVEAGDALPDEVPPVKDPS